MRSFLNAIKGVPHAEERPRAARLEARTASLQSSFAGSINFLTASFAGKTRRNAAGGKRRMYLEDPPRRVMNYVNAPDH
jgi:hypothetical protein